MPSQPDIVRDKLKIWVHFREYADVTDYWDGNWLMVTVTYDASGPKGESKDLPCESRTWVAGCTGAKRHEKP